MEIKFIYNSNQIKEREALAYAKSLDQHYINEVDLEKETLTERHWAEIAKELNIEIKELIDQNNDYFQDELKNKDFDEQDLLQLITSHPQIIKTPIIQSKKITRFIQSPYDFNEMDLAFEEIKKHFANKGERD